MASTPFAAVDSDTSPALLPLATQQAVTVSNTVSGISGWTTGDYKVSAQAADHADPGGGNWLICDGTATGAANASLVALIGSTRPDARGRALVMQGTNATVSSLLANEGTAVANRRGLFHRHTLPWANTTDYVGGGGGTHPIPPGTTILGTATDPLDGGAFIVPGNLFIHT